MDKRNTIQTLRIISLVLGIVSAVFFIATKTAHCEEGEVIYFPTDNPYMASWEYSPFMGDATKQQNAVDAVDEMFTTLGWNIDKWYLTFYTFDNNIYTCYVQYNGGQNNGLYEYGTYLMSDWLNGTSNRSGIISAQKTIYLTTNGELYSYDNNPLNKNSYNNFYTNNISTVTLTKGSINRGVPVYIRGQLTDITGNSLNTDTGTVTMIGGSQEDFEDYVTSVIEQANQITQIIAGSANDTIDTLTQATLQNWFQGIITELHNGILWLYGNLTSAFQPAWQNAVTFYRNVGTWFNTIKEKLEGILDKLDIIIEYIRYDLSWQNIKNTWLEGYHSTFLYSFIQSIVNIINTLKNIGDAEQEAPVITVNLSSIPMFANMPSYTFDFLWYNSIRTPLMAFFTAFMIVEMLIQLAHQAPNIIKGASATSAAISGAAQKGEKSK